jgi:hypothetical protein
MDPKYENLFKLIKIGNVEDIDAKIKKYRRIAPVLQHETQQYLMSILIP